MPKKNKVKFNICNVHYALQTLAEDGTVSFETPVSMPGAVSLALDANGEPSNFYADGYAYYTISNNMGYDGDLELAMVPESFRTDVLKEELDSNKVLVENANVELPTLPCSLSLTVMCVRSAMCCIIVRQVVQALNPRPMRMRSKCRRKHWL